MYICLFYLTFNAAKRILLGPQSASETCCFYP